MPANAQRSAAGLHSNVTGEGSEPPKIARLVQRTLWHRNVSLAFIQRDEPPNLALDGEPTRFVEVPRLRVAHKNIDTDPDDIFRTRDALNVLHQGRSDPAGPCSIIHSKLMDVELGSRECDCRLRTVLHLQPCIAHNDSGAHGDQDTLAAIIQVLKDRILESRRRHVGLEQHRVRTGMLFLHLRGHTRDGWRVLARGAPNGDLHFSAPTKKVVVR